MHKKVVTTLAVIFALSGFNVVNAADINTNTAQKVKSNIKEQGQLNRPERPPFHEFQGPNHHGQFNPPLFKEDKFKMHHPSKEDMEAQKAEIDKRLNLTDKQKKQIEQNRKQDREKMKPIMDDIQAKKKEFRTILNDENLSQAEKDKQLKEVKASMKELKDQAEALRKENMNNFENILTKKQKQEFSKIKEEKKKEMEQRKKEFEKTVVPPQKK